MGWLQGMLGVPPGRGVAGGGAAGASGGSFGVHLQGSGVMRRAGVSECGNGRGCPCGCEESGARRVMSEPGHTQCHMRKEPRPGWAHQKPATGLVTV